MTSPFPLGSGDADDLCGAEGIEAVDESDADVDLGGLAVGVSGGAALASAGLAIVSAKGGRTHRLAGRVYTLSMTRYARKLVTRDQAAA